MTEQAQRMAFYSNSYRTKGSAKQKWQTIVVTLHNDQILRYDFQVYYNISIDGSSIKLFTLQSCRI